MSSATAFLRRTRIRSQLVIVIFLSIRSRRSPPRPPPPPPPPGASRVPVRHGLLGHPDCGQRVQGCPNVHCPSVQHYIAFIVLSLLYCRHCIVFIVLSLLYCPHCIVFDNVRKGEKLACVKNLVEQIGEFKDVNISSFT